MRTRRKSKKAKRQQRAQAEANEKFQRTFAQVWNNKYLRTKILWHSFEWTPETLGRHGTISLIYQYKSEIFAELDNHYDAIRKVRDSAALCGNLEVAKYFISADPFLVPYSILRLQIQLAENGKIKAMEYLFSKDHNYWNPDLIIDAIRN